MEQRETTDTAAGAAIGVGIEVSKATLEVARRPSGEPWCRPHAEAGIAEVGNRRRALGPAWIVRQATGGLERLVVAVLALATLPVAVVHPRQARALARATGHLATTDALDAAVLAPFAPGDPPAAPSVA
jgi:transposase